MFGDSLQSSPVSTLGKQSGGSLASLYQARKANDSATVEQIKQHFQKQIEQMLQSSERHNRHDSPRNFPLQPPPQFRPSGAPLPPSRVADNTRVSTKTNIERGKSFHEARTAVQKQIEKMFVDTKEKDQDQVGHSPGIKHASHGVSHVRPEEEEQYQGPPPVHYGVTSSALRAASQPAVMDLGNIDISGKRERDKLASDRAKRSSMHEDIIMKSVGVAVRDRKNKEEVNIQRRISIHQDNFHSDSPSLSVRSPTRLTSSISPAKTPPAPSVTISSRTSIPITSQSENEYEPIPVPPPPPLTSQNKQSNSSISTSSLSSSSIKSSKCIKHRIEYLGAVPLGSKATNLQALQIPLKELYFKNKALKSLGHSNLPGTLEILDTGMKIQYIRELHKGVQEIFNSFPTIAVWAAVKFVYKNTILPSHERRHKFSFMPLISDPEGPEKTRTFYDLDYEEISLAMDAPHPPIFACVMRRAGMPKQLECHGFICQSSEDAIIIAANLYQSLLDTMRKNKAGGQKKIETHPSSGMPRQELTRRSIRKSVRRDPPIRPPRRKRTRQSEAEQQQLVRRRSIRSSTRSARSNRSVRGRPASHLPPRSEMSRRSTRRQSTRARAGPGQTSARYNGDLFTKVSIGRTKSFVKTGNQYNLQELFRELKEKEGVDSIDDVLKRVISPDGMSFNDIKPVYRELLLKLAMTMSQDEIFERSKTIMAHNKKKRKRHPPPAPSNSGSLGSFFKSFSKSSSKNNSLASKKSPSTAHTTLTSGLSAKQRAQLTRRAEREQLRPAKSNKTSSGKVLTKADISGPIIMSTKGPAGKSVKEEVEDVYMSCSECGGSESTYESVCNYEGCTCREARGQARPVESSASSVSSVSECDHDSCSSSEKCYCSLRGDPRQSSATSSSSLYSDMTSNTSYSLHSRNLSGCDSPGTAWRRNMSLSGAQAGGGAPSRRQHSVTATVTGTVTGTLQREEAHSGYTSNDSYASQTWLHVNNGRNQIRDGRGSSGGSSCSSESQRSLSSPRSSSQSQRSLSSSSQSHLTSQNNRSHKSKILMVSAVDPRNNNLMYKGENYSLLRQHLSLFFPLT